MKKLLDLGYFALSFFILSIFVSCDIGDRDKKEMAEDRNETKFNREAEKDADFLVDIYSQSLYNLRAAEQAKNTSASQEAKDMAMVIEDEYRNLTSEIKNLANRKNVTLPADLTEDQKNKLDRLRDDRGADFDKDFAKQMKRRHNDIVDSLEKAIDDSEDPDIRSWAANMLADVQQISDDIAMRDEEIQNM